MDKTKPRCPTCEGVSTAIYRREGKNAVFRRIDGWAFCADHGPVQTKSS